MESGKLDILKSKVEIKNINKAPKWAKEGFSYYFQIINSSNLQEICGIGLSNFDSLGWTLVNLLLIKKIIEKAKRKNVVIYHANLMAIQKDKKHLYICPKFVQFKISCLNDIREIKGKRFFLPRFKNIKKSMKNVAHNFGSQQYKLDKLNKIFFKKHCIPFNMLDKIYYAQIFESINNPSSIDNIHANLQSIAKI